MANIKIVGRKYGTERHYYSEDSEFYYYDKIDEKEFSVNFPDIHAAEKWFLENHPDYYLGCNVRNLDNGDFSCNAVPEYWERELGTNNRERIIKHISEHFFKTEG